MAVLQRRPRLSSTLLSISGNVVYSKDGCLIIAPRTKDQGQSNLLCCQHFVCCECNCCFSPPLEFIWGVARNSPNTILAHSLGTCQKLIFGFGVSKFSVKRELWSQRVFFAVLFDGFPLASMSIKPSWTDGWLRFACCHLLTSRCWLCRSSTWWSLHPLTQHS